MQEVTIMISSEEYAKIVARNLRRIMYERGVSQSKLAHDLNLTKSTVSSWMNGYRTPRMSKIDMLCEYLHCKRSDLMEPHSETKHHHTNAETEQIAQYIYEDSDLRLLFDAARGSDPENLKLAAELLKRMKETNNDG
jgi:transcriptional regulator with XRE-family HTH domain